MNESLQKSGRPTVGLALSGSGNRTTFYIGFLESLDEQNIPVDYIAACSGGSLVAAAYACGNLESFKKVALNLDNESFKKYISKGTNRGGLLSLEPAEEKLREFTGGKIFEEVRPLMSFVTVDIETGEQINLCMGDIAKAAIVSCTLPGVFEPTKWGNRTLVDGGLLSQVPVEALKEFPVDITIGVNMRGTKHIFTTGQITVKKVLNILGKILLVQPVWSWLKDIVEPEEVMDFETNPSAYTVVNKSLDLAVEASENERLQPECDLMITPAVEKLKGKGFNENKLEYYYQHGRKTAQEYGPKIRALISQKMEAVKVV